MTSDDPSGYARRCAAIALGFLGDPAATGVLEKALKDPETLVRTNAQAALKMLRQAAAEKAPPQATFGPVIERVLPSGASCTAQYFQFHKGEILFVGKGPGMTDEEFTRAWKQAEDAGGVDCSASCYSEKLYLIGRGCVFSQDIATVVPGSGPKLNWDATTAEEAVTSTTVAAGSESIEAPTRELPSTYLFKTGRGETGIMQILGVVEDQRGDGGRGMKFRYKLVQGGETKTAAAQPADRAGEPPAKARSTPQSAATSALLAQPPQLRFLAWKDEWGSQKPHGAFHADGSLVTDLSEMRLLRNNEPVGPRDFQNYSDARHPRFLHFWFSHPLCDEHSMGEVASDGGAEQSPPPGGEIAYTFTARVLAPVLGNDDQDWVGREAKAGTEDHCGWLVSTVANSPKVHPVTVRLRYTLGPWQDERQFPPDKDGLFDLGNGSTFDGAGEAGNVTLRLPGPFAFCKIARDQKRDGSRQVGVWAVTTDGRELSPYFSEFAGNPQADSVPQLFWLYFRVPLAKVAHFRIATRPVRTVEFQNVATQPKPAASAVEQKQAPAKASAAGQPPSSPNAPQGPLAVKIRQALKSSAHIEFVDVPAADLVQYLSDCHNIPFHVSGKLEETPMTLDVKDVTLAAGLQAIEDKYPSLQFVVRDDGLLLTEWEVAKREGYYPAVELAKSGDGPGRTNRPGTKSRPSQ
jgi:hypothetical protein